MILGTGGSGLGQLAHALGEPPTKEALERSEAERNAPNGAPMDDHQMLIFTYGALKAVAPECSPIKIIEEHLFGKVQK